MAAGECTTQILDISGAAIETAIEALRVTANDKFYTVGLSNGQQVAVVHIEEA